LLLVNEKENISFVKVFEDELLAETDYPDNLLKLYKLIFEDPKAEEQLVIDKLSAMIEEILNAGDKEYLYKFIESLLENKRLKEVLSNIIIGLELNDIKKLSLSLQRLTYDYLCDKDKVFELENNLLLDMMAVDARGYKNCIMKVVKSRLPDARKLSTTFELLDGLKYLTPQDKSEIYNALKEHKDSKKYDKEVKAYCKKFKAN